jgi:PadR family transcriptional regulator, regulatory protein PadR
MNDDRDLYSGMIRLHVLHHAEKGTIFGAGMSEELARHGYKLSPGTMYPILHGLEKRGYLQSSPPRLAISRIFSGSVKVSFRGREVFRSASRN